MYQPFTHGAAVPPPDGAAKSRLAAMVFEPTRRPERRRSNWPAAAAFLITAAWFMLVPLLPITVSSAGGPVSLAFTFGLLSACVVTTCTRGWQLPVTVLLVLIAAITTVAVPEDEVGNLARVLAVTMVGAVVGSRVARLHHAVAMGVAMAAADTWSVFSSNGTTRDLVANESPLLAVLSGRIPVPGLGDGVPIGLVDVAAFALFIAVAHRFRLGTSRTVVALILGLISTGALLYVLPVPIVPALPPLVVAFVAVHAMTLWANRPRADDQTGQVSGSDAPDTAST